MNTTIDKLTAIIEEQQRTIAELKAELQECRRHVMYPFVDLTPEDKAKIEFRELRDRCQKL